MRNYKSIVLVIIKKVIFMMAIIFIIDSGCSFNESVDYKSIEGSYINDNRLTINIEHIENNKFDIELRDKNNIIYKKC